MQSNREASRAVSLEVMLLKNVFEHANFYWVRYSAYELKQAESGVLYIVPTQDARPVIYNPLENTVKMVLNALNVGMRSIQRKPDEYVRKSVMEFVSSYGLLGIMTALPTTPYFMDYRAVYLPRNHFLKEETLTTEEYLSNFFPFGKLDVKKNGEEYQWDVEADQDMKALTLTFSKEPTAMNMSLQRLYAERYDWVLLQLKDLAYNLLGSFLYYEDYPKLDETQRALYRQSVSAFGSNAPSYHVALLDRPVIVWDYYSLLSGLQLMVNMMLADEEHPVRLCRNCQKVFIAENANQRFCCSGCADEFSMHSPR